MLCPKCNSSNWRWFSKPQGRLKCNECGRYFTVGTALHESSEKPNINIPTGKKPEVPITGPYKEEYISDNVLEITSSEIKTLPELLSYCKVNLDIWKVESFITNKWPTVAFESKTTVDKETGNSEIIKTPVSFTNIQVKARLRKIVDIEDWEWFKNDFIKTVEKRSIKVPKIRYKKLRNDYLRNMLEINIYDLHLGKLGWNPETGDGNYDYKIARGRFHDAIDYLLMKASTYPIEKIIVPFGHDFFNSDVESTGGATTTAGTAQQNDVRWQKMWTLGRELAIEMVEKLKVVAPVELVIIPGNHDKQKMFYLGDLLQCVYKNDPNVQVDNSPKQRKYKRYGNTLLGFTHAVGGTQYPPEARLLQLMPTESDSRYDFADTEFHEIHVGHVHHRKVTNQPSFRDHQGIAIRYMASLSAADAWHSEMGFKGAVKGAEALIYNYMTGPDGYFPYNLVFDK